MGFKRLIINDLELWRRSAVHKPLILRGARQVGKTTLVREFGQSFDHFIELNLEKIDDRKLVENSVSAFSLMENISLQENIPRDQWSKTLLFIDEIQEMPKAIEFLRYFYEELSELYVIAAGSLLEHSFSEIRSFPVGRVNYMYLFPLNFQEYLLASGKDMLLERLKSGELSKPVHNIAREEFHRYCIVGGMPEVVSNYLENKDMAALTDVYESIWDTYKDDITKYAQNKTETLILRHIMDTVPSIIDKRVKFQNFGNSNYKSREVGEAMRSLDGAKVVQIIYPTTDVEPPLVNDKRKSPRLQVLDTGLLNFDLGIQADLLSMKELSDAYRGAIIPHMIIQEVLSLNKTSFKKPNFWVREKSQSSAEVDLLRVVDGLVIPIEIKSGATGSLKSLHEFIDRAPHAVAARIYGGEYIVEKSKTRKGKEFTLINLPYYLGTLLDEYIRPHLP